MLLKFSKNSNKGTKDTKNTHKTRSKGKSIKVGTLLLTIVSKVITWESLSKNIYNRTTLATIGMSSYTRKFGITKKCSYRGSPPPPWVKCLSCMA